MHQLSSITATRYAFVFALFIAFSVLLELDAQCSQPAVASDCVEAEILCCPGVCYISDFTIPNGEPENWCGNQTQVHNPQYFQFVAISSEIRIEIEVGFCSGSGCGLQAALIDTCLGKLFPWNQQNVLACDPGALPGETMMLTYTLAQVGKTYWVMIDGCSAQNCEYTFTVCEGMDLPELIRRDTFICGDFIDIYGDTFGWGTHLIRFEEQGMLDSIVILTIDGLFDVSLQNQTLCALEDSVLLVPQITGHSGGYTFLWNDGSTDAEKWVGYPDPEGFYVVTVTDSTGCEIQAASTVRRTLGATIQPDTLRLCALNGLVDTFGILAKGGTPPYLYVWAPAPPGESAVTGQYSVTVTDAAGCEDVATVSVVDGETPEPIVVIYDTLLCHDEVLSGVRVFVNPEPEYQYYAWSTGLEGEELFLITITDPGFFQVTVTSTDGCEGSAEFEIVEYPNPVFEFGDLALICPNILAEGIGLPIPDSSDFDSIEFTGDWEGQSPSVNTPGTYGIVVTDTNGCTATDIVTIDTFMSVQAAFIPVHVGGMVAFSNTSVAGNTFHWDFGDGQLSSERDPIHVYPGKGIYAVQLIASNPCGTDTFTLEVIVENTGTPPNDICAQAMDLGVLETRDNTCDPGQSSFDCWYGSNFLATSDTQMQSCITAADPVAWHVFTLDNDAAILNIEITSDDIQYPFVQLFRAFDESCSQPGEVIPLSKHGELCARGSQGSLSVSGTEVVFGARYHLAVGSFHGEGGLYSLCLNVLEMSPRPCATDARIEVTSRSLGGSLDGPFLPGEELDVCMTVSFEVSTFLSCQWFQGIVPVFGNGWDPASFDDRGQPLLSTMNESAFPAQNLYNEGSWDWWINVPYHHPVCFYNVGDFDANGTMDMCHALYQQDCHGPGFAGGCCGNCFGGSSPEDQGEGDILPPGWFTAGVDGSCATLIGWPGVDWGDGNICNGSSGPWNFCFRLKVNDRLDTLQHPDLSLGFFSFSDGETGAWFGLPSQCSDDMPVFRDLSFCPDPGTVPEAGFTAIQSDSMVHFANTSTGAVGFVWDFGDGSVSTQVNPVYSYVQSGTYAVTLLAIGECRTDTLVQEITVTVVGIGNLPQAGDLKIYPNPNVGSFVLVAEDMRGEAVLRITDVLGRHVYEREIFLGNQGYQMHFEAAAGVYLVQLEQGSLLHIGRIVLGKE